MRRPIRNSVISFNSYYEAVGPRHPRAERGLISRPSADEVRAYRAHVDSAMDRLLAQADDARWPEICGLLDIGLNHEQQHQELILMDIKHVLSCNPLQPAYDGAPRAQTSTPAQMDWLAFPGGLYHIGHSGRDGLGFAFDNEGPQHRVWLEPFKLASRLVTCGEYLGFIEDDGYQRPEFWLSDGWRTVADRKWRAPLYWDLDARTIFTLSGTRAIDPHEPVCHVSYYEADAYARWAGKRLAREGEWEVAAAQLGGSAGGVHGGFHPQATEGAGLTQMFGETWQWTASAYCAYPGYRPAAGAIGEYNGKFMCGQFVLRGSAAITPRGHGRLTYRNFFPPDARWAFSGVRLADDDA